MKCDVDILKGHYANVGGTQGMGDVESGNVHNFRVRPAQYERVVIK